MPSSLRLDLLLLVASLLLSPPTSVAFTAPQPAASFVTVQTVRPSVSTSRLYMRKKELTINEASANGSFDLERSQECRNGSDSRFHHDEKTDTVTALGLGAITVAAATAGTFLSRHHGMELHIPSVSAVYEGAERFLSDPTVALQDVVTAVESMGPLGALYFGVVYTLADLLAIPAFPLTASAGYLFGVTKGTGVVLASASIAAAISFVIGRTILRSYVENLLLEFPQFQKIDRAIGKEGFKLMLLLRLSPIFPFALSNYLYGASSVGFMEYFFGTMIGFTPGTVAYVYSGEVGKALTMGGSDAQPLYVYAGGFFLLLAFLKVIADVATGIIEAIDDDE
jgi:uncharacterized membrane protein YdjX (TVP38/TMEM64 family)